MVTALTQMTAQEADGTGLDPAHSGGLAKINAAIAALNLIKSGVGVIAIGAKTVTIAAATIGGSFGGKPASAMLTFVDGTLTGTLTAAWSGHDLVITGNANATAETAISWTVDGRA